MSNIKQLNGLKVEAIAIPIKEGLEATIGMIYGKRHLCFKNSPSNILLPEGEWEILGRADELTRAQIYNHLDKYPPLEPEHLWHSYMESNNLTNELILKKWK